MSRPWPTLAAACWVARSFGRFFRPSGARPVAIAPEETRSTWWPPLTRSAMAPVSAAMRASSIPRCRGEPARGLSLQTPVRASRAGHVAAACLEFRVPVEDDRVVEVADEHGGAGVGPRLREGLLDAEPGQPV